MPHKRDEFPPRIRRVLAERAGYRCSRPECGACTTGPLLTEEDRSLSIGVAAHITGAALNGFRYNSHLTTAQRKSVRNGIWLCRNCHERVDADERLYTAEILRAWKSAAEREARTYVGKRLPFPRPSDLKVAASLFLFAGCVVGVVIMCEHRTDADLWWCGWVLALLCMLALVPILLHQDTPIQSMDIQDS